VRRDPTLRLLAAYPVLHHALRQREVPDGAGGRVSPHQATVLAHLDKSAAQTLSELAAAVGVAMPTMSLLVDRLVHAGLIRRERDSDDRRRVALRLTAAGDRAAAARSLVDPERVRALLASLAPGERAASVEGVVTLANAARRLAGAGDGKEPTGKRGGKPS
jgi:DNA-binding MarR family transcriptional regulator